MYTLFYDIMSTNDYNTIQYNTIQYNTIQYNTIQYNIPTQWCLNVLDATQGPRVRAGFRLGPVNGI